MFERLKERIYNSREYSEKGLARRKSEFEKKIQTPNFQEDLNNIIENYGLKEIRGGFSQRIGSLIGISLYRDNKTFLLDLRLEGNEPISDIIRNKKPPFVVCRDNGQHDDRGDYGEVFIPINRDIRISSSGECILGYGVKYFVLDELGYKQIKPEENGYSNNESFPNDYLDEGHSIKQEISGIIVYELGSNPDKSLLTAHLGRNWQFK